MFGRLFGKNKDNMASTSKSKTLETLEHIQQTIELIEKRESVLEKRISDELEKAKAFYTRKNQKAALQCLKRKKMYEEELVKYGNQKNNLETTQLTIQGQSMNANILKAHELAGKALKADGVTVEKAEKVMDDLSEQMDRCSDLSNVLGTALVADESDDLVQELDELMKEDATSVPPLADLDIPEMRKVPSNFLPVHEKVPEKENEDEELLRALEEKLAI